MRSRSPSLYRSPNAALLVFLALILLFLSRCGDPENFSGGGTDTAMAVPSATPFNSADPELNSTGCADLLSGFGPQGTVNLKPEVIVTGLEVPWGLAFISESEFLITERPGRIRLFRGGRLAMDPVATLTVGEAGEGGLLGIALHPDFETNRMFYVYYTMVKAMGNVNRVERFVLNIDHTTATSDKIIIDDIPAGSFHNGGRIRIGPDRHLYIGTGDARDPKLAQTVDSPAGKILRLTLDGGIPPDNPFGARPAYLMGIRNTQGFDWLNFNTMIVSDHGPTGELARTGGDEISVAVKGSNLGWPSFWRCDENPQGVRPLITWANAVPPGGAAIYTGTAIPAWNGDLIVATLRSEHLQRINLNVAGGTVAMERNEVYLTAQYGRLREAIMGPDGHLYVTTSNCDGRGSCGPEKDLVLRIR